MEAFLSVFPFLLANVSLAENQDTCLFFALHGHREQWINNSLHTDLLDAWRWLLHIHRGPWAQSPIISFFIPSLVFQHLYHSLLCSGLSPSYLPLHCRAVSGTVLLLKCPPCLVQWLIPSRALHKWWCLRSPWVPCTLFAALSQGLPTEYSHCKICFGVWCSGFSTPIPCRDSLGWH